MQRIYKNFILILLTILISTELVYPQLIMDPLLLNEINNSVSSKYGPGMIVQNIYNIDSSKIPFNGYPLPHKIYDEYNQLNNAIVFTCLKYDSVEITKGLVGVYRNGAIIWDSDTTINFKFMNALSLFSISDINRDGNTDLIFAADEYTESSNGLEKLYIYSWDGNNGRLISEEDENGISTITSFTGYGQFDFVDVNGDGIFEIRGLWVFAKGDKVAKSVTYYWNGINYSFNLSMPQPQEYNFLTQNKINTTINATVNKSDSGYTYNYWIHNLSTSTQEIYLTYFQLNIDSLNANFPPKGWNSVELNDLFGFEDLQYPTISSTNNFVKIGSSVYCSFRSFYLPSVIKSFIQAYNETPSLIDTVDGHVVTFDDFYNNIMTNSNKSHTIGPTNLFDTLNIQGIVDTINSYCNQSFLFGWIKNQTSADKYTNYFTTAKTQLQQNNIAGVKNTLNQVLQDVDVDSTSNLTSEAYALIKYNTEYLLNNLPEETTANLTVKLTNSTTVF